ncbi:hypothetical protein AB2R52_27525, partial [Klebsiella pneumoniae]|uniref:hypothetical protein n=1 Tax=Klebsiella pneumoniae TaxID=573 RepID=UPI003462388F
RVQPGLALTTAIRQGGDIPNVPKETATLAADYTRPLPEPWDSTLALNATFAFRSDQLDAASGLRSGDVRNLSLRASLEKGPYKV